MIRRATVAESRIVADMAIKMWTNHDVSELADDFAQLIALPECAVFIMYSGDVPIGFAQCQLRHDYVEGTESSPVGYLEGIFVEEVHRRQGYARELLAACQTWAKEQGCAEFASDCELDNAESLAFHLRMGFIEANRIICFTKKI